MEKNNSDIMQMVFTCGATAGLKLVGEGFPWQPGSSFVYTMENHTSVLGIREYARKGGARVACLDMNPNDSKHHCFLQVTFNETGEYPRCIAIEESQSINDMFMLQYSNDANKGQWYLQPLLLYEVMVNGSIPAVKHILQDGDVISTSQPKFAAMFHRGQLHPVMQPNTDYPAAPPESTWNLFAFPGECNFCGDLFDLGVIAEVQKGALGPGRWMVVLDAAKFCGGNELNLQLWHPDFVVVSFYKIFGYPTGLGGLIMKKSAAGLLHCPYFGGGTVEGIAATNSFVKLRRNLHQRMEYGTVGFTQICQLSAGLRFVQRLGGVNAIGLHSKHLAKTSAEKLQQLKHYNGSRVVKIYGQIADADQGFGAIVTFNILRADGSFVGYAEVERLANLNNIVLRTGAFCNIGSCQKHLELTHDDIMAFSEAGHVCWDVHDIINGKPTGAIRASFGYASTTADVQKFVSFIQVHFVETLSCAEVIGKEIVTERTKRVHIEKMFIYPIKSCGGQEVDNWQIEPLGLAFDRGWVLVDADGVAFNQKRLPRLANVKACVDIESTTLIVTYQGKPALSIDLNTNSNQLRSVQSCNSNADIRVCGSKCQGYVYSDEINAWFQDALGVTCFFVRQSQESTRFKSSSKTQLSFANDGQFLLVNTASITELNHRLASKQQGLKVSVARFRPNFVISGLEPYEEDVLDTLVVESTLGSIALQFGGPCGRCEMVNIDQSVGVNCGPEPLLTLSKYRRIKGRVHFGVLLSINPKDVIDCPCLRLPLAATAHLGTQQVLPPAIEAPPSYLSLFVSSFLAILCGYVVINKIKQAGRH